MNQLLLFLRQTNLFIRFSPAPSFSTSDSFTWLHLFSGGGLNNKTGNLQQMSPQGSPKGSLFKAHVYKNLTKNFWGYFCVTFRQPDWNHLQSLPSSGKTIFECNTHSLHFYDAHTPIRHNIMTTCLIQIFIQLTAWVNIYNVLICFDILFSAFSTVFTNMSLCFF